MSCVEMNEIELHDYIEKLLEIEEDENEFCESNLESESNLENFINNNETNNLKVGILGCGTIADIITDFTVKEKLNVDLNYFYDQKMEKAETLASLMNGIAVCDITDMINHVDLVVEAASQEAVIDVVPQILKKGKDVIIMSVGALMDLKLRNRLKSIALKNNSKIYIPSGAIVGLDGIKAASIGQITEVNLITRKPPESLGIKIKQEKILYEGKASEAVHKFPKNMNVAATLSIVCDKDVNVKIIADPKVDNNCHQISVIGDFGELKTTTQNRSCITNPKTSVLAAYSVIKLLRNLNENLRVGT